jgi:hypothetical protein
VVQKIQVLLVDDLDGSEAEGTVRFLKLIGFFSGADIRVACANADNILLG